jgi:DNA-binding response OmpR family regulator
MRLLVAEDDPKVSRFLVRGLREDHHFVDLVQDGEAAEDRAWAGEFDAIVLDVVLPKRNGCDVCRARA